jgi:pentatricopeptide repeat protein
MSFLERAQGTGPRQLIRVLRSFSSPTLRPTIRHIHIILRSIIRREKFMAHGCGWNTTAAKYSKKRTFNPKYPEGRILGTTEHYHPTAGLKLPRRLRLKSWFGPILQSVSQQAIQSDRATIALRLKYEALARSDMGTSRTVFRNMLAQGLHPTIHHYSTLMDGYAKMGDIRGAKQVFQDAFEAGFQPNAIMYTILVNGYGRRGKPEEAMRVFRAMIRAGIVPDVPSIDAVAHAYFAVGAYSVARRVLREMWAQVQPFPPELEHADLRTLAVTFRSYSLNPELGRRKLSVRQQRLLHWKMRAIKTEWMRFEQWTGSSPLSGGIDRHDGYPQKGE